MGTEQPSYHVQIVDDDDMVLDLALVYFKRAFPPEAGHRVDGIFVDRQRATVDGLVTQIREKLADALGSGLQSILILDSNLGFNCPGVEVFAQLPPGLPVFVCSGGSRDVELEKYRSVDRGATLVDVVSKPLSFNDLVQRVLNHLAGSVVPIATEARVEGYGTIEETLTALKDFAQTLAGSPESFRLVLGEGKLACEKAIGFVENHLATRSADSGQIERELRIKVHAIRNVLTALLGYLEKDLEHETPGQSRAEILGTLSFIISILETEESEEAVGTRLSCIEDLMQEFQHMHSLFATQEGNEFPRVFWEAEMPKLDSGVNLQALRLILMNMLMNAFAHPDIHEVRFSGSESETEYLISVTDDGPQLPGSFLDVDLEAEGGSTGNGARHMLSIARAQGWTLEMGEARAAKFVLKIPKAEKEKSDLYSLLKICYKKVLTFFSRFISVHFD